MILTADSADENLFRLVMGLKAAVMLALCRFDLGDNPPHAPLCALNVSLHHDMFDCLSSAVINGGGLALSPWHLLSSCRRNSKLADSPSRQSEVNRP